VPPGVIKYYYYYYYNTRATSPALHLPVVSPGNLLFGGEPSREASLV